MGNGLKRAVKTTKESRAMPKPKRTPERIELPRGWFLKLDCHNHHNEPVYYLAHGDWAYDGFSLARAKSFGAAMNESQRRIDALSTQAAYEAGLAEGILQSPAWEWRDISTAPSAISAEPEDEVWVFGGRYPKPTLVQADGDWWRSSPMLGTARYAPTHWQPQYVPPAPTGEG